MLQSVVIAGFVALQGAVGCHNLLVAQKEGITSYVVIQLDLPIGDGPAQVSEHRCCPWATRWAPCPHLIEPAWKRQHGICNGMPVRCRLEGFRKALSPLKYRGNVGVRLRTPWHAWRPLGNQKEKASRGLPRCIMHKSPV